MKDIFERLPGNELPRFFIAEAFEFDIEFNH